MWREVISPLFLTLTLDEGEWSVSHPCNFNLAEVIHGTHWLGSWVGPRARLAVMNLIKFLPMPGIEPQASSPLLYQLYNTQSRAQKNRA
jgi:hypothetical protein